MIKQLLFTALATALAGQISAKEITAQQALSRFNAASSSSVYAKARRANAANRMKLVYTSSLKSQNTYYVFDNNQSGGFVILSADDNMPAVLGYVDNGSFDYNNMPENMKFYLKCLDATVSAYAKSGVVRKTVTGSDVAPLLGKTEWDQGKPFNNQCPQYAGGAKGTETAYVGCVACAVAQVMRKWQYPATGTGSRTYKFWWDTKTASGDTAPTDSTELTSDFSSHTYDWTNMIDKYNEDSPNWNETQGNAVALLLSDVGIASKMCYGTAAAGGSGAQTYDAGYGMVNFFGYDKSMQFRNHKFYTDDEWQQMSYDELAAGRPIIFGGTGATGNGGHEYVCDGFQASDGMFHINWGWNGSQNGYFVLTGGGLVPSGTGSGGAKVGDSYGYNQDALFGVKPDATGSESAQCMATVGYSAKADGNKLTLTGKFYNQSYNANKGKLGIKIIRADNQYQAFEGDAFNLGCDTPEDNITATITGIEAGTYRIQPVSKRDGDTEWSDIYVLSSFKQATVTIDTEGKLDVTNNDAPKIEAQGAITASKNSFRPTKKNDEGKAVDAETLELTCEAGIKNCDSEGHKLYFGCEFYDLTESDDETDVYWLTDYQSVATSGVSELAAGGTITSISVEIIPELEAGHEYEVNPIFYQYVDETLNDDAYWDKLDEIAQYVDLGNNEAPVIKIEDDATAIKSVATTFTSETVIYGVDGTVVKAANVASLPKGTYIVKDARGVRKIVKK